MDPPPSLSQLEWSAFVVGAAPYHIYVHVERWWERLHLDPTSLAAAFTADYDEARDRLPQEIEDLELGLYRLGIANRLQSGPHTELRHWLQELRSACSELLAVDPERVQLHQPLRVIFDERDRVLAAASNLLLPHETRLQSWYRLGSAVGTLSLLLYFEPEDEIGRTWEQLQESLRRTHTQTGYHFLGLLDQRFRTVRPPNLPDCRIRDWSDFTRSVADAAYRIDRLTRHQLSRRPVPKILLRFERDRLMFLEVLLGVVFC